MIPPEVFIPYGVGQSLDYTPGPKLGTFNRTMLDTNYKTMIDKCQPVYDAIKSTRQELDKEKSLIGFAGAPWTLYRYMTGNHDVNKFDPFDSIEDIKKLCKMYGASNVYVIKSDRFLVNDKFKFTNESGQVEYLEEITKNMNHVIRNPWIDTASDNLLAKIGKKDKTVMTDYAGKNDR